MGKYIVMLFFIFAILVNMYLVHIDVVEFDATIFVILLMFFFGKRSFFTSKTFVHKEAGVFKDKKDALRVALLFLLFGVLVLLVFGGLMISIYFFGLEI